MEKICRGVLAVIMLQESLFPLKNMWFTYSNTLNFFEGENRHYYFIVGSQLCSVGQLLFFIWHYWPFPKDQEKHWGEYKCVKNANFTGHHLCRSLFLLKLQAKSLVLLKKRLWHRSFSVNFAKNTFSQKTSGQLLLPFVFILREQYMFWIFELFSVLNQIGERSQIVSANF